MDSDGRPLNPMGRTGLRGRGVLGRWGPNHAADPIVSRYFKGHLQFIGIQRSDTGEWAIPGGMIDPGEMVSHTLKRFLLKIVFFKPFALFFLLYKYFRKKRLICVFLFVISSFL